uniref:tRNA-dihydrouridine(16/17) synthase [NAD(P)(+)] n=2 Tax=Scylla olivacea TaxID=85551 RepID=A0A0N7ZBR3_SCYOL
MPGPRGYDFWRETLGGARLAVAPMVDASELAWRLLSRRYGTELCYTPMLHAHVFVKDARYRRENLASCPEDRPLIVQFCANDPDTFVAACQLAAPHCDAVDLNLGCPQAIARRGHYGAFLQDEWDLVRTMIERASTEVDVPITAKIRVFEDVARTVEYARMLEGAGVSLLTVHGRTREQKGPLTGLASWPHIKAVKEAVKVPLIANGNIQYLADVERCLAATGADGVMSAEGNLHNPALYAGTHPTVWQVSLEYLHLALEHPCPTSYSRGHVFKLLHHCLSMPENFDLRYRLSKTSRVEDMIGVVEALRDRMSPYHTGEKAWEPDPASEQARLPMPPWLCQPYVRIPPEEHLKKVQESQQRALQIQKQRKEKQKQEEEENEQQQQENGEEDEKDKDGSDSNKRPIAEEGEAGDLSKKKKKKMVRNPRKSFGKQHDHYEKCVCRNPKGGRCSHGLCRACCKVKCYTQGLDCPGHRILVKTKREKAAIYYAQQEALKKEEEGKEGRAAEEDGGEKLLSSQTPQDQRQEHQTMDSPPQQEPPLPLTAEAEARESGKTDEPLGPEGVAAEESIGTLLQEVPNGLPDDSPPLTDEEKDSQDSGLAKAVT